MPVVKKETVKGFGATIVTDKVKTYANDPALLKGAAETKEFLSKTDLSIIGKKRYK